MPNPQIQWIRVADFTPGIRDRLNQQGGTVALYPVGSAVPEDTWRCVAIPGGGLGPLPKRSYTLTRSDIETIGNVENSRFYISGFYEAARVIDGAGIGGGPFQAEFIFAFEWFDTSTAERKFMVENHPQHTITSPRNISPNIGGEGEGNIQRWSSTAGRAPTAAYFTTGRSNNGTPTSPGQPSVHMAWAGSGTGSYWYAFPNPSSPNADTWLNVGGTTAEWRYLTSHQDRVVCFAYHPFNFGTTGSWSTTSVYMTETNRTSLESTEGTTFGQEYGDGLAVVHSASASELMIVRSFRGGYIVRGDIASPNVQAYPGVQPARGIRTEPTYSPIGLVYMSEKAGVWAWPGGEESNYISANIDPLNFELSSTPFRFFRGGFSYHGDWIFCPNNWVYDWRTRSWWRLDNPADYTTFRYVTSRDSDHVWGVPTHFSSTTSSTILSGYRIDLPADSYRWKSQPILIAPEQRGAMLREVIVTAQGNGTVTITVSGRDGQSQAQAFSVSSNSFPQQFRTLTHIDSNFIQVQIDSTGSSGAPVVYEVRLGVRSAQHIPETTT